MLRLRILCSTLIFFSGSISIRAENFGSPVKRCRNQPIKMTFSKNGKELIFIGAQHGMGPESNNPTFQMIRRSFDEHSPKAAIGESRFGSNPPLKSGNQECKREDFLRCGEHLFTASLASERKIRYEGAEPSEKTLVQRMMPKYTMGDYLCFKWMVQVAGATRGDFAVDNPDVDSRRQEFQDVIRRTLGVQYSFKDFERCYVQRMKKELNLAQLSSEDFRPLNSTDATFFQQMMFEIDKTREPHIVETIKNALRTYSRILVVYGTGHLDRQYKDWVKMMGAPKIQCGLKENAAEAPQSASAVN